MLRPYVTINAAVSCDGKLASRTREKFRFSSTEDARIIDELRRDSDAILVGATTLEKDNPHLIVHEQQNRDERVRRGQPANPAKVTISPDCIIDPADNFFQAGEADRFVFTTAHASPQAIASIEPFATVIQQESPRVDIPLLLQTLYERGIRRLLVEGGGSTNFEFIKEKVVDEIRIAVAPLVIGGASAPTLVDGFGFVQDSAVQLELIDSEILGGMVILRYKFRDVVGSIPE